jgi:P27 family predicted phage terminase small subunit
MGKGRKPLPQEVLNLRGTARKDRQRPAAAITGKTITNYDIQCVSTPGYSTLTPRGRKIFSKACRTCIALKMLEPIYLSQLVAYARELDLYLDCCESVLTQGRVYKIIDQGGNEKWVDNPAVHQGNNALRNVQSIGSNFGFTPVDRQKLKLTTGEDPLAEIKRIMLADDDE